LIQRDGIRAKLLAADGNYIDAMFLDRRINSLGKYYYGNKLVTIILITRYLNLIKDGGLLKEFRNKQR